MPKRFLRQTTIFMAATLSMSVAAFASNSGVTYQGRILKPDGTPLSGVNTQFKLQLRTPDSQDCLMYEEIQSQDLSQAKGVFSLTINDGSGTRTDSTGLTLDRIFANRGTFTLDVTQCTTGTGVYAPNVSDGRNLVVLFKDETMMTWEPIPAQKINFVPFAFETKQIAGFTADSLLRVVGAGGDPLMGLAPLSNAQYTALMDLANGTSSSYTKAGQLNGVALPAMSSGEVLGWNGSAWVSQTAVGGANSVTTAMIQANAVDASKIATGAVGSAQIANAAVGATQIASGAVGTTQIANNVSISTSGTLASAITTTRDFKIYTSGMPSYYVGMQANPAMAGDYTLTWPLTAGSANQVLTTDGSGALSWTNPATSSQWTTHGANISYDGGGNVGIGTTSPTAKLDVNGAVNAAAFTVGGVPLSAMQASQSVSAGFTFNSNSDGTGADGGFSFQSGGTNLVTISNGGDVNIASTTQSSNYYTGALTVAGGLGVNGNINAQGTMSLNGSSSGIYTGSSVTNQYPNAGAKITNTNFSSTDSSYSVLNLGAKNTSGNLQYAYMASVSASGAGSYTPSLAFGSSNGASGYQERMRIDSAGRVGIGTTAPAATLDVSGGLDASGNIRTTSGFLGIGAITPWAPITVFRNQPVVASFIRANSGAGLKSSIDLGSGDSGGAATAYATLSSFSNTVTDGSEEGSFILSTMRSGTNTEALRVLPSGYVGIGTTSPAQMLSIAGTGYAGGWGVGSVADANKGTLRIVGHGASSATNAFHVSNSLNTPTFVIRNDGNVGIGTTSPAAKLDIVGTSDVFQLRVRANSTQSVNLVSFLDTGGSTVSAISPSGRFMGPNGSAAFPTLSFLSSASGTGFFSPAVDNAAISTSGAERLRVTASGAVGIGTTAPNVPLDVVGTVNATSYTINGSGTLSRTANSLQINNTSAAHGISLFSGSTASSPAMLIQNGTANVGIATTAPVLKLDVAGSAIFRGPTVGGVDGELFYDGTTHAYQYYNGSSWVPLGTGTITYSGTLWNQNGANLYYNTGSVGIGTNAPASTLSVSGGTSIGASYAGTTAPANGLIVQGNVGINTATPGGVNLDVKGSIRFSGTTSGSITFQAPSSGSNYWYTWPSSYGTNGQVLASNGSGGLSWTSVTAGTVTNVTATAPLTVANGATTPALSIASGTQAGQTLRWNGTSSWVADNLKYTDLVNTIGSSPWPATCGAGQALTYSTVSDAFSCTTLVGGAGPGFANGGNALGADLSLGSTDGYGLSLLTSGSPRMTISPAGDVGIGAASPSARLDVNGHIAVSGSAATLGSCGTSAAIIGNDTRGTVTVGTGTTTSCVVSFNSAYATAPFCTITWRGPASTIGVGVSATTTEMTVAFSGVADGLSFNYQCLQ